MKKNHKIIWKDIIIEDIADDGVVLKGILHYWEKEYTVYLKEPFEAKSCGSHLMYSIPARFVTTEAERVGIHDIDLCERAKEILISLYLKKESLC